ncbi:hypothetical protein [Pseudoclavibacter sp. 13-3]|uniref:hypothetical protein n=1 Tax=Pseudoclavibacter sp. 13-3 TaxID=2901228 RepID=UPI001E5EAC8F|nr:hypothetical protein [Pseudoclavibacter sp. 13-3]MCD7101733.1 hypothetical protein [Pseudoclavibacter sp. 13-3]
METALLAAEGSAVDVPGIFGGIISSLGSDVGAIAPTAITVGALVLAITVGWRLVKKFARG